MLEGGLGFSRKLKISANLSLFNTFYPRFIRMHLATISLRFKLNRKMDRSSAKKYLGLIIFRYFWCVKE